MRFRLRIDAVDGDYTKATLFANGGNCGRVTLENAEFEAFVQVLESGVSVERNQDPNGLGKDLKFELKESL